MLFVFFAKGGNDFHKLRVERFFLSRGGKPAAKVFFNHRHRAREEVAQVVGKVRVDARNQKLVRKRAVRTEREFAHQVKAQRVHAVAMGEHHGVDHIAL